MVFLHIMSGRFQFLSGKRRGTKRKPGNRPNPRRQRQLAARKRKLAAAAPQERKRAARAAFEARKQAPEA